MPRKDLEDFIARTNALLGGEALILCGYVGDDSHRCDREVCGGHHTGTCLRSEEHGTLPS